MSVHLPRPVALLVATVVAGAGLTLAAAPAASASAPAPAVSHAAALAQPDQDPFYSVPAHLGATRDGAVLRSRRLPADALAVPSPAAVWQLLYKTRDNAGKPTATVATLLVPTARWTGPGARPLVSYQVPEDGLSTVCAPSYVQRAGAEVAAVSAAQVQFDRQRVADAVSHGWAVVVPDYEGPGSQFLGANAAGYGVLDGIRAARSFAPAHVDRKAPLGLWGYSGGGFATTAAAKKQAAYAPELRISGIAAGGVISDLNRSLQAVSGGALSSYLPFAIASVRNAYPQANVDQYVNASGKSYADAVSHTCLGTAVVTGPHNVSLASLEAQPGSLTAGPFHDFLHSASPVGYAGVPTAPVYMYHGTADELIPVDGARELVAQYRAAGVQVRFVEDAGQNHQGEQQNGIAGAVAFLDERFAAGAHR
ncbi:lipase family protein [Pseudonocardia ailaonensis]|uniref:Lipase family protein n=1 Tax=Pseudonocardia ailaonensis TaxID=367279 RepID=A0ABN2NCL9_9PSEU